MKIKYLLIASVSLAALVAPFAEEQTNSVQLRKMPPNGGNIQNGPETVATIDVQTDAGPVRINRSDYDPSIHTAINPDEAPAVAAAPEAPAAPPAPPAAPAPAEPTPPAPAPVATPPSNTPPNPAAPPAGTAPPAPPSEQPKPVEKFVTKTGKKWFVTDGEGKAIDPAHAGYDTEAEAQAASKA